MTIIKLSKSGVQPPVYIAGSFSDPAWLPQEMEYRIDRNGEYEYFKDAPAEDGKEYQYKFRLGPGDWWILDEESPTVMDNIGNRNNLLSVPIRQQVTASSVSAGNSGSMIQDTESGSGQASGLVGLQPRVGPQDHSDIQQWTTARELANVAAAVAHHDGAQDTPPMSEGDVGEIDGPRMSDIPIQKPAKKTTVGGDVSGILEEQGVRDMELPPSPLNFEDGYDDDSFPVTPGEDQVPLFPHEFPGPKDKVVVSPHEYVRTMSWSRPVNEALDLKDPSLVPFPTDRDAIMAQLWDVERRQSMGPETPRTPSSEFNHYPGRLDIPSPSMRTLSRDQSASLHSIVEEQEVGDTPLASIPNSFDFVGTPEKHKFLDPAYSDDHKGEVAARTLENPQPIIHVAKVNIELGPEGQFLNRRLDKTLQEGPGPRVNGEAQLAALVKEEEPLDETQPVLESPLEAAAVVQVASPHTSASLDDSDYRFKTDKEGINHRNPRNKPPGAPLASSSNLEIFDGALSPKSEIDSAPNDSSPMTSSDETHSNCDTEPLTSDEPLRATIQPARKWSGTVITVNSSSVVALNSGETTSIAHPSELKQRKQQPASAPLVERPRAPSSIRSATKDPGSRNLLVAFWRVIFVDWIGGFISKLWGRHT